MSTPAAVASRRASSVWSVEGYGVPVPSSNMGLKVEKVELATSYRTYRRGACS
jgi:hypothetical protein